MGIIINSGLKIKILKEFLLLNVIVDRMAMKSGGRKTLKSSAVFSGTGIALSEIVTIAAIRNPLANIVKRQAANAVRNLPPKIPLRGPDGLMTRQTPYRRNLKSKKHKYIRVSALLNNSS